MEEQLELHLRSKCPMVWLSTPEEERAVPRVQTVAERLGYGVQEWACTTGFGLLSSGKGRLAGDGHCTNVNEALPAMGDYRQQPTVFVVRDMDRLMRVLSNSPDYVLIVRRVKDLYRKLLGSGNTVVFLACTPVVPADVEDCMTLAEVSLPTLEERTAVAKAWASVNCVDLPNRLDDDGVYQMASAAAGMTCRQVQSAMARSVVRHKSLVPDVVDDVLAEKTQVVRASDLIEFVALTEREQDVGGLAIFKDYLRKRAMSFSRAAQRYGLPEPKGVMLVGPPGVGKTIAAKMCASIFRIPLLRLDMGRMYGSLVGESEGRQRRSLALVESQAPAVLWIDEVEKGFAGAFGPSGDSGVSQRLLGGWLTWMQEHRTAIYVVATANNVHALPPEFLRRGRFDEVFFVDLPNAAERRAILDVLLRKRGVQLKRRISESFIERLDKYTGAELDCIVTESLYEAFSDNQRPVAFSDLEAAAARILPLADQMRQEIEAMRNWGRNNARSAS